LFEIRLAIVDRIPDWHWVTGEGSSGWIKAWAVSSVVCPSAESLKGIDIANGLTDKLMERILKL